MLITREFSYIQLCLEYSGGKCFTVSVPGGYVRSLRILLLSAFAGSFLVLAYAPAAGKPFAADNLLQFKWAFIHRDQDGKTKTVDFKDKVVMRKGDGLRVYLEPLSGVYLYLYMFDSQKQLRCIFPSSPDFYEKKIEVGHSYLLPSDEKWFIMDEQAGTENFFLLASSTRLVDIENLTKKMIAVPGDAEIKARLLDEIKTVRRSKGDFSTPVEKGVPIAGTVIAVTRGPSSEATMIEASVFYSKTLRIIHE